MSEMKCTEKCMTCRYYIISEKRCQYGEIDYEEVTTVDFCQHYYRSFFTKYGLKRNDYLKEHHFAEWEEMFLDEELEDYLIKIEKQASEIIHAAVEEAKKNGLPDDFLERAAFLNNAAMCAEEIVNRELIYPEEYND